MKILIIHSRKWDYCTTVKDYAYSFKQFSRFEINYFFIDSYSNISNLGINLQKAVNNNDIVCINYTGWHKFAIPQMQNYIRYIKQPKIFILQDEYQFTKRKKKLMNNCDLMFVNMLEKDAKVLFHNDKIYKTVFTGYISDKITKIPIKDKAETIFYRGRTLHYIFGQLGQDKINIGKQMKKICEKMDISHNIAWGEKDRIYQDAWLKTLGNSKVTLATECGCKIFDYGEVIKQKINIKIAQNNKYTYEQANKDFKLDTMAKYKACEISPKMFEAVALGTVLVMYPGKYKDIFKPNIHYIELEKDFSNIEEVIKKIQDDNFLQTMADRAHKDIVEPGKYSYQKFVELFDKTIQENIGKYLDI